ncbi:hypothetical protein [Anoxynatronum sibiricum]|uniref:Uncharacterized protein n=1 Tax=Anoxynatronum sibiricum TaxID=210623 RepID=A0ABU9VVG5_9CLOT
MMNRNMKHLMMATTAVTMMTVGLGVWMMNTQAGKSAASRLTSISVEFLVNVIHVMVGACKGFVA